MSYFYGGWGGGGPLLTTTLMKKMATEKVQVNVRMAINYVDKKRLKDFRHDSVLIEKKTLLNVVFVVFSIYIKLTRSGERFWMR